MAWLFAATAPPLSTDDLLDLLSAVVPTFAAVALLACVELSEPSDKEKSDFYRDLNIKAVQLSVTLHDFNPGPSCKTTHLNCALLMVLDVLENAFTSWKGDAAELCVDLGLERKTGESYPKLNALRRILPEDGSLATNDTLSSLGCIIRLYSKSLTKRGKMLMAFDDAFSALQKIPPGAQLKSDCPVQLRNYPVQHAHKSSRTLFVVLERSWRCKCNSQLHISRPMKLNLTEYQRFEIAAQAGCTPSKRKTQFRILFPTSLGALHWQHTDIAVENKNLECAAREVKDNLCRIIDEAKASIVPKMAVFNEKLWQVQYERGSQAFNKVPNGEFESLEQLLRHAPGNGASQISSIDMKERIILCFTLVTSFFHIFSMNNSGLQASITSSNICFRTSTRYLNIMKPYLNIAFLEEQTKPTARRPEEIHWFPSILTLGVVLLEISRGSKIEFVPGADDCVAALAVYEKWKDVVGKLCSSTIPEGLFEAILSCIDPNELRKGGLDRPNVADMEIRKYIFERILYPLGDALSNIYKVPLHTLHDEKAQDVETDTLNIQKVDSDAQLAGKQWRRHLESLHDMFYHHHVKDLLKLKQADVAVKIAVLDTGFQLDEALQENYKAEGRIVAAQCKSFCSQDHDNTDWDVDIDGHGTYVGQIVLDVAPTSELYVAKVFRSRKDLQSQEWAVEVQQNVANAIKHATEVWNVDMIIMSFGFEGKIGIINKAMINARKLDKPPLFFAATRNDGANKRIAWPASDHHVLGISSTDGNGAPSPFNPDEDGAEPILYAFGEGVKVNRPAGNPKLTATHISGTSFAAPTAAALAANLISFVRLALLASSDEDRVIYAEVPEQLEEIGGLLRVMQRCMMRKHLSGKMSLLPWDFLNKTRVAGNVILKDVSDTLSGA